MAQQVNISQAQFKSLYFNENYSSQQIADEMGISMGLLRRVAADLNMPLSKRPKGKRYVLNFIDDEQQETPQVESVAVENENANDYTQNQEAQSIFQTVQD